MSLKVCIAGVTGWTGKDLSISVSKAKDLNLVGAVSRFNKGKTLREVNGEPCPDLLISGSVTEALTADTDVLVDYTSADVVKSHVMTAIERGVHVVIGTSGLTEEDFVEIERAAIEKKVGVIAAGNFSLTAVLLERFACEAAKHLSHWEIIDYASATKVDAPSGTTRELAHLLSKVRKPETLYAVDKTVGPKESRGAEIEGSRIHSIRLPSYTIAVEIIFGETDERLTIRHDAGSGVTPYLHGTLLAIRKVKDHIGLTRGLGTILD
jgi:4-hydroxy-tetrahydrodipicolinate reductase